MIPNHHPSGQIVRPQLRKDLQYCLRIPEEAGEPEASGKNSKQRINKSAKINGPNTAARRSINRDHKGDGFYKFRGNSFENAAFPKGKKHKTKIFPEFHQIKSQKGFPRQIKVAYAAVDKFGAFAACSRPEGLLFKQNHAQSAQRSITGNARPRDTTAHHSHVKYGFRVCHDQVLALLW